MWKGHRLRESENRKLGRIFVPKMDKVIGSCIKLHDFLFKEYRMNKSRRL